MNGWQDTPFMQSQFEQMIDGVNQWYANPGTKGYVSTCEPLIVPVLDSKVRFKLNEVYFLDNTVFNGAYTYGGLYDIEDYMETNHPESLNAMNHIFVEPPPPFDTWSGNYWGEYVPYHSPHAFVWTRNSMGSAAPASWTDFINHIVHEYGHAVGLHHITNGEQMQINHFDFLDDIFGQCPEPSLTTPGDPCYYCSPPSGYACYLTGCFLGQYPLTPPVNPGDPAHPFMSGGPHSFYLSQKQAGRMHRALSLYNNTFVVDNMPMHKYVEERISYSVPYTVTSSETWDFAIKMYQDIIVEAPSRLTIQCEVRMPIGGKIVVMPGAELIVDGGVVTCAHDGEFWHGIEVWGNTNQHQFPADHPTYQGLLVLKNGALIEHAREAVTLWKPGDWNTIGGVVQVQGTHDQVGGTFLNCRRAVGFLAYQNFHPGYPNLLRPNNSYFNYAHFRVDDDYRGVNDFFAHVSMWKVDGVQFRACTFENAQSLIPVSSQLGHGIETIDANYTVRGNCTVILPYGVPCPEASLDRGAFIGLDHGIHALDGGSGRGFTADKLRFENNVVGVYASGLSGYTVTRNQFVLGDRDVAFDGPVDFYVQEHFHRGVSSQASHGFRIEENTFERAATVSALGLSAVVIENSGPSNTQVYKNEATDMELGYVGEGTCADGLQASSVGHQFLCNDNNGNGQDFWARKEDVPGSSWDNTIRTQQGSNGSPAGNTFDQGFGESDYKNSTEWVINYWHAGGNQEPIAVTAGWVGVTMANVASNCPSRFNQKEIKLTEGLITEVEGELQSAKAAYISTAYAFNSLLDGGNTDVVVVQVQESWPEDAWELRDYLMSKSPYLSTEVLVEMMKKNVLPQAMVLEICLANPEATKKEGFTKWAEFEAPNPLPSYMIDLIAGSWAPKTFRMQLEAQMGQHHADMTVSADLLQASYRVDEENIALDDMLAVWHELPNYGARYAEVALYLRQQEYTAARTVLNDLAASYPMKEARVAERDRTLWYIDQLEMLANNGRNEMQLTTGEIADWLSFAEVAADIPGRWAENILCFGYAECPGRSASGEGGNKSLRPTSPETNTGTHPALVVQPNPANAWATLAYTIEGALESAYIRLVDARGREVATFPMNTAQGQQLWDTRQIPTGVYTVELFNRATKLSAERLVVQREQ